MRNLECISLIEKSQSGKTSYYVNPTVPHSLKGKTMKMIETSVILGDEGRRDEQVGHRIFRAVKIL